MTWVVIYIAIATNPFNISVGAHRVYNGEAAQTMCNTEARQLNSELSLSGNPGWYHCLPTTAK
jgi:hypothetical protein